MKNYADDFGPFDGRIWLNTASEGPLPKVSVRALQEATEWKIKPFLLTRRKFQEVPQRLKSALARLVNTASQDIILGNSATYGIHLLANGLPFHPGDEILLMQNDFPSDILPWLGLRKKGVVARQVAPREHIFSPEEIAGLLTDKTRLLCLPHVHTFSGFRLDVEAIGRICRERKVIFVLNISQSAGYHPVDLSAWPVDAVTSAGFKWLCGPYGTGFCWVRPDLRQNLDYNHAFWVNCLSGPDLETTGELSLPDDHGASRYDVFGTANFFNFHPWTASIEYLQSIGIPTVQKHNDGLVELLLKGLRNQGWQVISPTDMARRTALVVFSHARPEKNAGIFNRLLEQGICGAFWKNNIRIAPHLFNTPDDIARLINELKGLAGAV